EKMSITPNYKVISESGPDHAKTFVVGVYIDDRLVGQGSGPSKQDAEVDAAKNALSKQDF
ncbi:MAG: putative dsRNA-binding protein, partial [Candidatus Doudnabacteria bacterium]|nr:putative dsRNA-binding protein [Candidatus Doudnabacteria bacterium]